MCNNTSTTHTHIYTPYLNITLCKCTPKVTTHACIIMYYLTPIFIQLQSIQLLYICTLVIWLTWYIPIIRQYYWGYPALIGNGIAARRTVTLRAKRFDSGLAPVHPPENCNQGLYLNEGNHMLIPTLNNMGIEISCYTCNDSLIFYFFKKSNSRKIHGPSRAPTSVLFMFFNVLSEVCHSQLLLTPKTHRPRIYIYI